VDPNPIPEHGKGVTLGDTLFREEGAGRGATFAPDHEGCPVMIAVNCKSSTGQPFILNGPEHYNAVNQVERVSSINK
jgi:hypothetical protein